MRILITGGFGYLGARVAHALAERHDIVLLTRGFGRHDAEAKAWAKRFSIVEAELTDAEAVKVAAAKAGKLDAVIHLAAVNEHVCAKDQKTAYAVNVFGTQHLLDAVAARRFLYLSTFHVYGDQEQSSITEATIPNPLHPYGITHFVAEQLCKAHAKRTGMELGILRLSNGIGAPQFRSIDRWTLLMLDLCRQAHEKGSITLRSSGVEQRDFISIDDLVQAVEILLKTDAANLKNPVFNVGSGKSTTVLQLAKTIQKEYEQLYRKVLPLQLGTGGNPAPVEFRINRLKKLGFQPTTDLAAEAAKTLRFCEAFK